MKVKEVMKTPYFADENLSLSKVAKIMVTRKISSLIYMENNNISGIVTESDLLKNFSKNKKIKDIMSGNVITIEQEEDLQEAVRLMKENNIKRLPVLAKNELVGLITLTDIAAKSEEVDDNFFFE